LIEAKILHSYGGLIRKGTEERFILLRKRSPVLVDDLHDPNDLTLEILHRSTQHGARTIACTMIDTGIKARVLIGIGDVEQLVVLRHPAGNPRPQWHMQFTTFFSLGNFGPEHPPGRIEEK
jgi:hypothetical protein